MSLKIIIIGAGLGGLAAAISIKTESPNHEVLVLESAPALAEIGAGLQLTPNATRLLERWGLQPRLQNLVTCPEIFTIHRYSDGKLLGQRQHFGQEMLRKYRANFWDTHRADLQLVLYDRAESLGVKFRFGVLVEGHNFKVPERLTARNHLSKTPFKRSLTSSGLWSKCRASFLGKPSPPIPTGDLAYRIVLRVEDIDDKDLREFASVPRVCLWVGPDCHAIYYPLRNNTMCNVVLLVPDNLPENVAKASGDLGEMHEIFKDWDPRLRKLLALVKQVDKWKLMHLDEMERWYNDEATVVFLGDSCHPMLPYMAQGAGSALEDGATLGILLSKAASRQDLHETLKRYESLRKPRSLVLQKGSMRQRYWNHLRDGPTQKNRDLLAEQQFQEPQPGYPFYWIDPEMQSRVYGYDVVEELKKAGVDTGKFDHRNRSPLLSKV
ncbi:uncharacterized protein Z518_11200 [Rhinocladiella mackenziei CBS 650.93]|uniref:FAD-binding domain-containing protein n=1 Tax=Rhinocladiella mackenziei CBS 650.93 TaxID=1442369 RepID=A0A0D2FBJ7_9EURO|nr:uncharacterized protein Z518_11200 [Rhinocladiella mackenziei CBS 650.93]KIW99461.1 hypothetical protein Z518_11200 [Rhinocladiella mackenziei CBS 650.93]